MHQVEILFCQGDIEKIPSDEMRISQVNKANQMLSLTPRGVRNKLLSNCTSGKKQKSINALGPRTRTVFGNAPILTFVAQERLHGPVIMK